MKPAKLRRNREELQKEAEANFIPEDAENPFEQARAKSCIDAFLDDTDMAEVDALYPPDRAHEGEE